MLDHVQFTLIPGPNIPGSYAVLFFTASDFTFTTSHITTERRFCYGSASSSFLELCLCSSPVACWTSSDLGKEGCSSSGVISFCLFILFMAFLRQEYWSGLPFPLPVTCPWVVLCGKAHSFTELSKPLCHNKAHEGEMLDWMDHNLESRLLGEISTNSDMQMILL